MLTVHAKQAFQALAKQPACLTIRGTLKLDPAHPIELPSELHATALDARGCTWLERLPERLVLSGRLDISSCLGLRELPKELRATSIVMRACTGLTTLPEDLELSFLDATDCTAFTRFPERGHFAHGHLLLRNCLNLRELPAWIESVAGLDLAGCLAIRSLPAGIRIGSFLDVAETALDGLPPELAGTPLRWRGAPVDSRIAFHPETLSAEEVLQETNVELRRVKLARMGYERFLTESGAVAVHTDRDPGGPRQLFRIELPSDEPLVCLSVICPSTARRYVLRVPPTLTRCHDAAAWIAGFDDPSEYAPELET
jgi:hypothetical protein